MNNLLIEYFKRFPYLSYEDVKLFLTLGKFKRAKKGELIIPIGSLNYHGIIVLKGLLRNYIVTSEGDEKTLLLSKEGMQTGSYSTIFYDQPSIECIQAIEPSILFLVDSNAVDKIASRHTKLLLFQNKILKNILAESIERIIFFTALSPEERFIHFREKYPDLIERVPQKYLASYIGVTTVSLSRIKNRIVQKSK